jgi:uncharacterized protein YukE
MMMIPNSTAMDATAASGGPITMLPQIVTGDPEQILAHVTQLIRKAEQFAQLMQQFEQAQQQLERAWSGGASESALKKITDSLQAFEKIIKVVEEGASLLGISAGMVRTAQTAYQSVVGAVNPTVAGLMSNPWTYSAAVALSTSTSATLRGFIQAVQGLLQALGAGKLAMQITTLLSIISQIQQLMNTGSGPAGAAGSTPPTMPSAPVIAPPPPSVVNPIGSGSSAGGYPGTTGTDPTAGGYPTNGSYPGTNGDYPSYPASSGSHPSSPDSQPGWIPVDPPGAAVQGTITTPGATVVPPTLTPPHAPTAPAHPDDVVVTVNDHGVSTTIDVPAGHDVSVDVASDGHVKVDVDGQEMPA